MLINCRPGCSGKRVTTTASLDVERDEVICEYCSESITVSSFVKHSMKQRGDIVKFDKRKSFQFSCQTCNKRVETVLKNENPIGINCIGDCKFNISKFTIHAMKNIQRITEKEDLTEEVE